MDTSVPSVTKQHSFPKEGQSGGSLAWSCLCHFTDCRVVIRYGWALNSTEFSADRRTIEVPLGEMESERWGQCGMCQKWMSTVCGKISEHIKTLNSCWKENCGYSLMRGDRVTKGRRRRLHGISGMERPHGATTCRQTSEERCTLRLPLHLSISIKCIGEFTKQILR